MNVVIVTTDICVRLSPRLYSSTYQVVRKYLTTTISVIESMENRVMAILDRGQHSLPAISVNDVHHDHHYRQEQDGHKDTGFQERGNPVATRTHDQRIHLVGGQ